MNKEYLDELCAPFPDHAITTKKKGQNTETWVEQHFLMERLNQVFGLDWSWNIMAEGCETVMLQTRSGEKQGQRAWCRGRLTLWFTDSSGNRREVSRDGVGEKEMFNMEDARKGSYSVSFRHAAKFFTTFLWSGSYPQPVSEEAQAKAKAKVKTEAMMDNLRKLYTTWRDADEKKNTGKAFDSLVESVCKKRTKKPSELDGNELDSLCSHLEEALNA